MTALTDQRYLRAQQYRDAANLEARIRFHDRFSTNRADFQGWIIDRLDLPGRCRVLELGCGPASLWRGQTRRIPPGWSLTLADLSAGMAREARAALDGRVSGAAYLCADAQAIPCADRSFDAVLANHMLYHVPDRAAAVGEIARVLRPEGHCYAATNGTGHLAELHELVARFDPQLKLWGGRPALSFTLQNGAEQLAARFETVRLERYEDGLVLTESAPLVDYIESVVHLDPQRRADLQRFVEAELAAARGAIRITKDVGLLSARRPRRD